MSDQRQDNPTPEEAIADAVHPPAPDTEPAPGATSDAPGEPEPEPAVAVAGEDVESAEEVSAEAGVVGPDFQDQYVRAVAELDNVRKRARRDVSAAEGRGIGRLAKELLPALDDLERALQAAEQVQGDGDDHLARGIRLVQQQLLGALTRVGIEADSPKGELFDPHKHEALAQQPAEGVAAGTVVEVYQPGYRYGETVLRAAKVVVAQ